MFKSQGGLGGQLTSYSAYSNLGQKWLDGSSSYSPTKPGSGSGGVGPDKRRKRLSMRPITKLRHHKQKISDFNQSHSPSPPPPPPEEDPEATKRETLAREANITQLNVILEEIEELGLIVKVKSDDGMEKYKFKESMFGEVLADTILPSERIKMHIKIAKWYETNPSSTEMNVVSILAHHWHNAEKPEKAIVYYAKAAELAMNEFSHSQASVYLLKAIALYNILNPLVQSQAQVHGYETEEDSTTRMLLHYDCIKWHRQLGECYYNLGNMEKALEHLEIGIESLKEPKPSIACNQEFHVIFPTLSQFTSEEAIIMNHKERMKKTTKGLFRKGKGNELEFVRIMLCFGQVYYFLCRSDLVAYCTLKALYVAEQMSSIPSELRRSLISCIITAGITNNQQFGQSYMKIGRILFKEQWDRRAMQAEGMFSAGNGEWSKSDPLLETGRKEAEKLGDTRTFEECSLYLALNRFFQGKMELAFTDAEETLQSARARGDLQMQILGLITQALIKYSLGKINQFYVILVDLEGYSAEGVNFTMDVLSRTLYSAVQAIKFMKEGNLTEAYTMSMQVEEMCREQSPPTVYFSCFARYYSILIRLLLLLRSEDWEGGQHKILKITTKKLISNLGKSIKQFEEIGRVFSVSYCFIFICKGLLDQATKKKSKFLEVALNKAKELGMTYMKGIAHHWIGSSLSVRDNNDVQKVKFLHRDEALKIFIELDVADTQLLW